MRCAVVGGLGLVVAGCGPAAPTAGGETSPSDGTGIGTTGGSAGSETGSGADASPDPECSPGMGEAVTCDCAVVEACGVSSPSSTSCTATCSLPVPCDPVTCAYDGATSRPGCDTDLDTSALECVFAALEQGVSFRWRMEMSSTYPFAGEQIRRQFDRLSDTDYLVEREYVYGDDLGGSEYTWSLSGETIPDGSWAGCAALVAAADRFECLLNLSGSPCADPNALDCPTVGGDCEPRPPGPPPGPDEDCDLFKQNCPAGQKCSAWAWDMGTTFLGARCVPVAENPGGIDDPCQVRDWPTSGLDDCGPGLTCAFTDETMGGRCTPLCFGERFVEACCETGRTCWGCGGTCLYALCLPTCDPLVQDCPDGLGCYASSLAHYLVCLPSHREPKPYGEPCMQDQDCEMGLTCRPGVPDCDLCCTPWCDLGDPHCPDAGRGQTCVEAGFDGVGYCGPVG